MRSPNLTRYSDDGLTVFIAMVGGHEAIIDAEDYPRVSGFRWWANHQPCTSYALASLPGRPRKDARLHRLIMNAPSDKVVDHINGNGLDNRKENLRICSKKENNRNSRSYAGTSRWKGVSWDRTHHHWVACITVDYKKTHLGCFQNEDDAAQAYNLAALQHYGEFAVLNSHPENHKYRAASKK